MSNITVLILVIAMLTPFMFAIFMVAIVLLLNTKVKIMDRLKDVERNLLDLENASRDYNWDITGLRIDLDVLQSTISASLVDIAKLKDEQWKERMNE